MWSTKSGRWSTKSGHWSTRGGHKGFAIIGRAAGISGTHLDSCPVVANSSFFHSFLLLTVLLLKDTYMFDEPTAKKQIH